MMHCVAILCSAISYLHICLPTYLPIIVQLQSYSSGEVYMRLRLWGPVVYHR